MDHIPVGFSPTPFPTSPFCLRSMCQLSVSPALFFSVKAKMAFPFLTASFRSASEDVIALLITSKAAEAGKASGNPMSTGMSRVYEQLYSPFLRDIFGSSGASTQIWESSQMLRLLVCTGLRIFEEEEEI
jgi:hypothetical protein